MTNFQTESDGEVSKMDGVVVKPSDGETMARGTAQDAPSGARAAAPPADDARSRRDGLYRVPDVGDRRRRHELRPTVVMLLVCGCEYRGRMQPMKRCGQDDCLAVHYPCGCWSYADELWGLGRFGMPCGRWDCAVTVKLADM